MGHYGHRLRATREHFAGKTRRGRRAGVLRGELTFRALRRPYPTGAETIPKRHTLSVFLKFALAMDWISAQLGKLAAWAVLAASVISAGNAFVRYGLDFSSNAWLEIQWYLFAATVMLGAPLVLKLNEHVRVDIIYGKLKRNGPVYVDLFGLLFFLLPVMGLLFWLTLPFFLGMLRSGEMSGNIGGLIRWPAALMMPVGFGAVFLQGVAEVIKRVAYLRGLIEMDTHYEKPVQ
ncbi:TRAP-type mannitol/chloroaromatic compound transport system, small permease component [Variovorax sp. PBS-H4]|nr:TRAP-type mannitol/chloroaromatic compound transport system, small permease component [Variovorax sp. PBS-H4]